MNKAYLVYKVTVLNFVEIFERISCRTTDITEKSACRFQSLLVIKVHNPPNQLAALINQFWFVKTLSLTNNTVYIG